MELKEQIEFIKQNASRSIVLVGLMGAGKSTLGRALAKSLGVEFVDSDIVVEGQERRTVADIFAQSGEAYFREMERKTLIGLAQEDEMKVIGTGGGAFMNDETRAVIKGNTISIFLQADLNVLERRIGDGFGRPLFEGKKVHDVLSDLIEARYPIYKEADLCVETKNETTQETLNRVQQTLYTRLMAG